MCHAFICDEIQMLTIVVFDIDSLKGDNVKAATTTIKLILDHLENRSLKLFRCHIQLENKFKLFKFQI
jgi:hypothetical protein